jgi:solute carrier family 35 (UDP-galactose transporter), member B1
MPEQFFSFTFAVQPTSWLFNSPKIPEIRLLFYIITLYGVFITWGYLQEKITTTHYIESQEYSKHLWSFPIVLNVFMNFSGAITASLVEQFFPHPKIGKISFTLFWRTGLSAALASPIGYFSLNFITYPMMILTKSCKPVPVMFIGLLFYRRTYSWYKYLSVFLLCVGISLFTAAKSALNNNVTNTENDIESNLSRQIFGLCLVLINLCLDGITSNEQDALFSVHQPSSLQMMKFTNTWQVLYLSIYLIGNLLWQGLKSDLIQAGYLLLNCEQLSFDIFIFCLCASFGQVLLFGLIREFGSLVWITVAVTRQLFTILLSVIIFNHHMNKNQWLGIALVFIGLAFEILFNYISGTSTSKLIDNDAQGPIAGASVSFISSQLLDVENVSSTSPKSKRD